MEELLNIQFLPNIKKQIHEVLESGGHVFTPETRDVLSHVASKYLVERCRLFCVVVNVLGNFAGYQVGSLQGFNQVPSIFNNK